MEVGVDMGLGRFTETPGGGGRGAGRSGTGVEEEDAGRRGSDRRTTKRSGAWVEGGHRSTTVGEGL